MNQDDEKRPRTQKVSKQLLASLKSGLETKKSPKQQKIQSKLPQPPSFPLPPQGIPQSMQQGHNDNNQIKIPKGMGFPPNGFPMFPPPMFGQMNNIDPKTQQQMKEKGMWMMPPFPIYNPGEKNKTDQYGMMMYGAPGMNNQAMQGGNLPFPQKMQGMNPMNIPMMPPGKQMQQDISQAYNMGHHPPPYISHKDQKLQNKQVIQDMKNMGFQYPPKKRFNHNKQQQMIKHDEKKKDKVQRLDKSAEYSYRYGKQVSSRKPVAYQDQKNQPSVSYKQKYGDKKNYKPSSPKNNFPKKDYARQFEDKGHYDYYPPQKSKGFQEQGYKYAYQRDQYAPPSPNYQEAQLSRQYPVQQNKYNSLKRDQYAPPPARDYYSPQQSYGRGQQYYQPMHQEKTNYQTKHQYDYQRYYRPKGKYSYTKQLQQYEGQYPLHNTNIFSRLQIDGQQINPYSKTSPSHYPARQSLEYSRTNRCQTCNGILVGIYKSCDRCARYVEKPKASPRGPIGQSRIYSRQSNYYEPVNLRNSAYHQDAYSSIISSIYQPRKNFFTINNQPKNNRKILSPPARFKYQRNNSIDRLYRKIY